MYNNNLNKKLYKHEFIYIYMFIYIYTKIHIDTNNKIYNYFIYQY